MATWVAELWRRVGVRGWIARLVVVGLVLSGSWLAGHGLWLHAKAGLAQALLARSWSAAVAAGSAGAAHRPWPWADLRPVVRLLAPQPHLDVDLLVLGNADGRSLAFGPGLIAGSALPGSGGHVAIAGHRDTHFAFLRNLSPGDWIELMFADGRRRRYQVSDREVVDQSAVEVLSPPLADVLTLVTCWPFDPVAPQGRERLVVRAVPIG